MAKMGALQLEARPVDVAAEVLPEVKTWDANERAVIFAAQEVKNGAFKPRENCSMQTTQSGVFTFQVIMPDLTVVSLTSLTLTVEAGNVGFLNCRVAAGQREILPVEEE